LKRIFSKFQRYLHFLQKVVLSSRTVFCENFLKKGGSEMITPTHWKEIANFVIATFLFIPLIFYLFFACHEMFKKIGRMKFFRKIIA